MNADDEIKSLKLRIDRLEQQLGDLTDAHRHATGALMKGGDLMAKRCDLIEADMIDAFERIKHIELQSFPHLASDITQLNKVIGEGDERDYNPLDFRDPEKKSP